MSGLRITLKRQGGLAHFPGLAQGREVPASALPTDKLTALRELARSHANAPASGQAAPAATHPDAMREVVCVEWDGQLAELDAACFEAADQRPLFDQLRALAHRAG